MLLQHAWWELCNDALGMLQREHVSILCLTLSPNFDRINPMHAGRGVFDQDCTDDAAAGKSPRQAVPAYRQHHAGHGIQRARAQVTVIQPPSECHLKQIGHLHVRHNLEKSVMLCKSQAPLHIRLLARVGGKIRAMFAWAQAATCDDQAQVFAVMPDVIGCAMTEASPKFFC